MKIADKTISKLLLEYKKVTEAELKKLETESSTKKVSIQQLALKKGLVTDYELAVWYSDVIDVPYVELEPSKIDGKYLKLIPEKTATRYRAMVFGEQDGVFKLAMEDPDDVEAVDFLQKQLKSKPALFLTSKQSMSAALDLYGGGDVSGELTKVIAEDVEAESEKVEVKEEEFAEDSPIAQTVTLLIEYAVKAGASDIHIEPREEHVRIRYRIDGVLKEADKLPKKVQAALISRIKILANLKIDERRIPQDGRFKITKAGKMFALRVSTLPIADGEKVVIRLLDESNKALSMEDLGFWGSSLKTINEAIIQPHGMVLVTGPTGSGKSTTLFSVLSLLNDNTVNISTVEDPIEYKIEGANQTQVNTKTGMTFASGLRALLRQDPNIIMVGEVRDSETADMAVQAALTGHLVFSTLHTNNAATCLPRLLDMGVEPFLIASTVRAVIGQRLVRHVCPDCRVSYAPDATQTEELTKMFGLSSAGDFKQLHELEQIAQQQGVGKKDGDLSTTTSKVARLWEASEKGCESCNGNGYKGRIGIYEVLENTTDIQTLIMNNESADKMQEKAIELGMTTMQLDGLIKALRGQTTIAEILRVTRE
ncbi:type II/IV secretion system protein [Candidatus Saccharibacteria bacterium]|nr:type II/IV secretion system protein [Candidatus Saccharibacteria bacterium]